jgi:hypothetical protein
LCARSALILLLAVLVGLGTGVLTALAGDAPPRCVLAGAAAAGASCMMFSKLIGS